MKAVGCSAYLRAYLLGLKVACCFIFGDTPLLTGRGSLFLELELLHVPARLLDLVVPGWPLREIMGLETCKMSKGPWAALCVRKMSYKRVRALTSSEIVQFSEVF